MIALRYTLKVRIRLFGVVTSEQNGPTIFGRIADVLLLGKDVVVIKSSCFFFNLRISQPLGGDYTADFFSFGCLQLLISRLIVKNNQTTFDVATCRLISKYFHP